MGKGSDKARTGSNDSIIPLTAIYSITGTVDTVSTSTVNTCFLFCTEAKSNTLFHF